MRPDAYHRDMSTCTTPYDPNSIKQMVDIVDRTRADNGEPTGVSRAQLLSDLTSLQQEVFAPVEPPKQHKATAWDLAEEEDPEPGKRSHIFASALIADDPLAVLESLSRGRSPSELFLLQKRIRSYGLSKHRPVEAGLPELKKTEWNTLSEEEKAAILDHMAHLEHFHRSTERRPKNALDLSIDESLHVLSQIFATQTHFDGIGTDLPYSATSRFVQYACLALEPFLLTTKLSPGGISRRWGRIKNPKFGPR